MLVVRSSPPSPYGRKVKIAASVTGLIDRITIVNADTTDPADSLRQQNPLGKIPALVLEDGSVLYDSRVIAEYLDHLDGGGRLIPKGEDRFAVLRMQALADGLLDAALLQVYETRFRPEEKRDDQWLAYQADKVARALAHLEATPPAPVAAGDIPHIGQIAVACALGYLDLRFAGTWRADHPALVDWLAAFEAAIPSFPATRIAA
ncbi:glutathione S-transferase family protein [Stappia taiwanensis]|uniref:Glutathione S-transferase family protein n=1 Tax=Stappia taiwanensis TaxID=992267 RepID=A0A838XR78_9HYPH|nr:glutathione S-transferase family protein [Stappia taiwanensis]MBA4611188.1 glutathione S-transferase family protein [Stappia taiwanensis]GGE86653.1 glutathione S-transferase [Stappia taiwanensis]